LGFGNRHVVIEALISKSWGQVAMARFVYFCPVAPPPGRERRDRFKLDRMRLSWPHAA